MDNFNLNSSETKKFPSFYQWKQFFKVLNKKEKLIFSFCFFSSLICFIFLLSSFYLNHTSIEPKEGGSFVEGVDITISGSPFFINPVYANSDIDKDLTELIYSGLMKYDSQGKIVPDLAETYKTKDEGKIYEVSLKKNLFWSDGNPLTVDDVIFTIKVIQNPDYKSLLLPQWLDVEVEKISDFEIRFSLKNPSPFFLENLTQKIIPKHIWQDFGPENFFLSAYNLKPIGSGPYKLKEVKRDNKGKILKVDLVRNQFYSGKIPYLSQISFSFFDSKKELIKAAFKKDVQGFLTIDYQDFGIIRKNNFQNIDFVLPRYYAVFLNPEKSEILSNKKIRQALNYATDKKELIEKILVGNGNIVSSPILPEIYGFASPSKDYSFNIELAKDILEKEGFLEKENGIREKTIKKEPSFQLKNDLKEGARGKEVEALQQCLKRYPEIYPEGEISGNFDSKTKQAVIKFQEKYAKETLEPYGLTKGTGIVSKATKNKLNEVCFSVSENNLKLKISLITIDQPFLKETANLLKKQWQKIGLELEIKIFDSTSFEFKEALKKRNYEALLYGKILNIPPDPFPFWHSSQKKDPGSNLAIYQNKEVDKLLEKIRETIDENKRKEKLEKFQNILIEDAPVVFLYNPDFIYFISKEIKGINGNIIGEGSKRFTEIENWYLKTKRVWK